MREPALRPATESDREFAYETKRSAMREYVEVLWGWNEEDQRALHERRFTVNDYRIVTVDGEDAGTLAVRVEPDGLFVKQIFLRPEYQSRGIGAWCMERVAEEAAALGLRVRLRVLQVNRRAVAFYERVGLSRTEEDDTYVYMEWATGCDSD